MIPKRTIAVSIILVFSFLFIGLAVISCLFLFVPRYIESEIIPSLLKDTGVEISFLKIRSIGLKGAEISDVKIGPNNDESLAIDSIRLDYSISGLLDRQLERVVLSGIKVNLEYENNRISVKGLESLTAKQETNEKNEKDISKPFTVNNLSVANSVLSLNVNEKRLRIPFDFTSTAFDQYQLPKKFKLDIFPGDQKVTAEGNMGLNNKFMLNLSSYDLSLNIFEEIINEIGPFDLKGLAKIELSANLSQDPISITDLYASCRLKETQVYYPGITIKNAIASSNTGTPIIMIIQSTDLKHWEYDVSNLLIDTNPVPMILKFSGSADLSQDAQLGKIKAITQILTDYDPPLIEWDISAARENLSGNLKMVINGKPPLQGEKTLPIKAHFDDILLTLFSPELNLQAQYTKGFLSGSYLIKIKDIVYNGFDMTMNIPDYRIKGSVQYDMKNKIDSDALISFKNGNLSMSENKLKINKISADLPFHWPLSKGSQKGALSIEKILYENYFLGPVNIDIFQKGNDIPFSGSATFPSLPDMSINISGKTTFEPLLNQVKMYIDVPSYNPTSRVDLRKFLPSLKGFNYKGNFKSTAEINFSNSGFLAELNLEIDSGTVENNDLDLKLENISLDLKLEDMVSIKSPFGQRLKIGRLSFGDIKAEDFTLDFKVDGPSLLFIEKGSFKWSGGHINIQSFRVNPEKEEYDLTLFCDRLKLSEILAQFGVANASGGGTVNGKLPVKISKNKFSFQDGFLYSTPGGGGKISITGTEILTAGLDPNSAQYSQMDIAREALKAFDYTWVKMSFESEKDELVLQLQFDGKPEGRLPFRYNKDAGRFIRVANSAEGSDFEGIGLDVNFRVPLDRILNIKDMLDMIN